MRAGRLNSIIDIEQQATTQDAAGQQTRTWTVLKSRIYANIRALSSRELATAGALQNESTHEVTIRYTAGITGGMRIKFTRDGVTRYMQIVGNPRNVEERDRRLLLTCAEGVTNG